MTNRIILHLAVAIALMPITSHAADSAKASEWRVGHQMDRMTEEPVWFASSKWIGPEEPTRPPFDNLRSTIGFECAAEGEWIGMAFSEVPRLRRTQAYLFEETRYVELRIRWDQTVTKMRFDYEPGDMYLQFHEADEAVRRLKQSKTVLVELPWEGEESVYLRFSLTGSRNAIERAQDQYERLPGRLATRAKQEKQLDALAEILCEAIAPGCMESHRERPTKRKEENRIRRPRWYSKRPKRRLRRYPPMPNTGYTNLALEAWGRRFGRLVFGERLTR